MGKNSCPGAMFASLYLHNHMSSYNAPYIIMFVVLGPTTCPLTSTPTNTPIKSYKVGLLPTHTVFSFNIWPLSLPSFTFTKGDIAQMIDLLTIFNSLTKSLHHSPIKSYIGVPNFLIGIFITTMTPNP